MIRFFFACVLAEMQFLGYKFGLKGLTCTQENTVDEIKWDEHLCYVKMFQKYIFNADSGFPAEQACTTDLLEICAFSTSAVPMDYVTFLGKSIRYQR